MNKLKKLFIIFMAIGMILGYQATIFATETSVGAASTTKGTFKMSLTASKSEIYLGKEFYITAKASDFKNVNNGIIGITGKLEFDADKLEVKSVTGLNSWSFSKSDYNLKNFKFVTVGNQNTKKNTDIFKITFKVKDVAKVGNTAIKFSSVEAGTGEDTNGIVTAADSSITVKLSEEPLKVGDIDGDSNITINDLAKLKLHLIDLKKLQGKFLTAADLDGDKKVTLNDLAKLKLILIK